MADFDPPFASTGEKRLPTTQERTDGFPCGPADQRLFNALFNRLEAELGDLVNYAGVAPSDVDNTTVRQAVLALIASATGGTPVGYILMDQARARLPIYPEILTAGGTITVVVPSAGNVRLPGGIDFLHRGIFPVTTSQTDFPTDPSKTYHMRWDPTNGFRLRDLANVGYNPSTLAETDMGFDSTFDDLLIARVITNSSNVATITNLVNKNRMTYEFAKSGSGTVVSTGTGFDGVNYAESFSYNFARTPMVMITGFAGQTLFPLLQGWANKILAKTVTRYGTSATIQSDYDRDIGSTPTIGQMHCQAIA